MSEEKVLTLRGKKAVWAPGGGSGPIDPKRLPEGYPYKAIEKTAFVENMSVTPGYHEPAAYEANFAFAEGQTYAVEWNGETYECIAFSMEGIAAIGNLALLGAGGDTGEPFIMYAFNGSLYIKGTDSSAAVTLSIYGQVETIHPMAPEFLPAGVGVPTVTADDNGKFLRVVNGAWAASSLESAEGGSF